MIEKKQGLKIACLEKVALRKGWIMPEDTEMSQPLIKNQYGQYLLRVIDELKENNYYGSNKD